MKIYVLGSSSSGNSFLFINEKTKILVDIGFSKSYIEKKLKELNIELNEIDGILISHEHQDHCKGLKSLQKTHKVFSSPGTIEALIDSFPDIKFELINEKILINDIEVISFKKNHDAKDPIGFILKDKENCVLNLTDFGCFDDNLIEFLNNFEFTDILLEANYDNFLLDHGRYPFILKERIKGKYGHCSNLDSLKFLNHLNLEKVKNIVLCHLSENNNSPSIVNDLFKSAFGKEHNVFVANPTRLLKLNDN
ncbi:MAG: MBL fold metallo-hydrolase [Candidatus Nanoarchaeia archaeon]|nr:MBL fold metallo-hydrolase [Candidatus Nanoarchaeia archaeon]